MTIRDALDNEKVVLTVEEMGNYLGVSRSVAYELVHAENGPPVIRLGRCIRIPRDGFEEWLREQSEQRAIL